jgi:hypothetical protein
MRRPVNDPGPEATAKAPMSRLVNPCAESNSAICGTSCAEKVPPVKRHNLDHLDVVAAGIGRIDGEKKLPGSRQRDAALLAGSIDGEKKHVMKRSWVSNNLPISVPENHHPIRGIVRSAGQGQTISG